MKDKKFLELLNLYLDGEIDPAGAVALEQEILSNPQRRRVYDDYCRIHRATRLVYEQFRAAGAAQPQRTPSSVPATRLVFPAASANGTTGRVHASSAGERRPFRVAAFVSGLAAACAVGVFIGTQAFRPVQPTEAAPAAPMVATTPPVVEKSTVETVAVKTAPAPAREEGTFTAPFAAEFRIDPFVPSFSTAQSDPFALSSLPTEEVSFDRLLPASPARPPSLKIDPRFQPAAATQVFTWPDAAKEQGKNPFRTTRSTGSIPARAAPADLSVQQP